MTAGEPLLQAKQEALKKAQLGDALDKKLAARPAPDDEVVKKVL